MQVFPYFIISLHLLLALQGNSQFFWGNLILYFKLFLVVIIGKINTYSLWEMQGTA